MSCRYPLCTFTATERDSLFKHEEICQHKNDEVVPTVHTTTSAVLPPSSSLWRLSLIVEPVPASPLHAYANHQGHSKSPDEFQTPPCNGRLFSSHPQQADVTNNHTEEGGERRNVSIMAAIRVRDTNDDVEKTLVSFTRSGKYYLARSADLFFKDINQTNIWSLECTRVPDEHLFPVYSPSITIAPPPGSEHKYFVKVPSVLYYDPSTPNQLSDVLLTEALLMEKIPPHPNIVTYFGCLVGENRIRGICLEDCRETLYQRTWFRRETVNMTQVGSSVKSAVCHLHAHGLCHNDISANNIMFREDGSVVLIDFDSCIAIGHLLPKGKGTPGFCDPTATHSSPDNDLFSIKRVEHYILTGYNDGKRLAGVQTFAKRTHYEDSYP